MSILGSPNIGIGFNTYTTGMNAASPSNPQYLQWMLQNGYTIGPNGEIVSPSGQVTGQMPAPGFTPGSGAPPGSTPDNPGGIGPAQPPSGSPGAPGGFGGNLPGYPPLGGIPSGPGLSSGSGVATNDPIYDANGNVIGDASNLPNAPGGSGAGGFGPAPAPPGSVGQPGGYGGNLTPPGGGFGGLAPPPPGMNGGGGSVQLADGSYNPQTGQYYDNQGNPVPTPNGGSGANPPPTTTTGSNGYYPNGMGGSRIPSTGPNAVSGGNTGGGITPGSSRDPFAAAAAQQQAANQASDAFNQTAAQNQAPQNPANYGSGGGMPMMGGGIPPMPNLAQPANNGNFLASAVKSFQDAQNAANAANRQMYNNINTGYNQLGNQLAGGNSGLGALYGQRTNDFASGASNVLGNYGNLLNSQTQGYGNIQNNQAQGLSNVGQGFGSMLSSALGNLNLLGRTEGTDLNEQFDRNAAQAQQSLVDRGLNNTTVTDSVNRGIQLDKERALTNLAQNVAGQTNNTMAQFGFPALQFGQQAIGANTALGTNALQNENQIAQAGLGAQQNFLPQIAGLQGDALGFGSQALGQQTQLGQNQLSFQQGVNQTGPDYNTLAQLMMAAGAAGTGLGTNGFNSLPSFPSQTTSQQLPGATFSTPNFSPPQPQNQWISALQQAYRPAAAA